MVPSFVAFRRRAASSGSRHNAGARTRASLGEQPGEPRRERRQLSSQRAIDRPVTSALARTARTTLSDQSCPRRPCTNPGGPRAGTCHTPDPPWASPGTAPSSAWLWPGLGPRQRPRPRWWPPVRLAEPPGAWVAARRRSLDRHSMCSTCSPPARHVEMTSARHLLLSRFYGPAPRARHYSVRLTDIRNVSPSARGRARGHSSRGSLPPRPTAPPQRVAYYSSRLDLAMEFAEGGRHEPRDDHTRLPSSARRRAPHRLPARGSAAHARDTVDQRPSTHRFSRSNSWTSTSYDAPLRSARIAGRPVRR